MRIAAVESNNRETKELGPLGNRMRFRSGKCLDHHETMAGVALVEQSNRSSQESSETRSLFDDEGSQCGRRRIFRRNHYGDIGGMKTSTTQ